MLSILLKWGIRFNLKGFKVLQSGLFTTLQDQGRYGYNHLGITHSGAMDEYAYLWSQKLLGNKNTNAIEVMVGLKLKAEVATTISVCGANLNFKINGTAQPIWQTHFVENRDVISFDKRISGQRAYLSVKDGFMLEKTYESYATTLKENIGAKLQKEDVLVCNSSRKTHTKRVAKKYIPNYNQPLTLRVLPSYQNDYFSEKEQAKFFNTEYAITLQSDRMGAKLKGESITPNKSGLISEGIAFGAVQIPKDGQPILLLKERQTIGGYPKIGTVLAIDCFRFSQLAVGNKVRFKRISLEEAREKTLEFYKSFK
ncbi:MAG: Allophanate hydrolase 2 subunit 2 (EC [uncultured Sulfurovum sp.]|uniref:Allophanate hydrolase 2 subunit 2 (EC) n=1 Tax=uncultured Sulfurovum sp. TaxID=269237 RepID=A0A6S6S5A6_9BACT|nr:MAG: Allophanate hydrolase 2 subunit 2 (EC [uncultured Sulfurovum sp.]